MNNCGLDPAHALAGLYIYGSVGSGKSLLMDMFFAEVEAANAVPLRRRLHFNAAMLEASGQLVPDTLRAES